MIPTTLVVGIVAGVLGRRLLVVGVLGVGVSLLFGVGVGLADESVATFAGGTGLAAANFVVGALVGVSLRALVPARRRRSETGPLR